MKQLVFIFLIALVFSLLVSSNAFWMQTHGAWVSDSPEEAVSQPQAS